MVRPIDRRAPWPRRFGPGPLSGLVILEAVLLAWRRDRASQEQANSSFSGGSKPAQSATPAPAPRPGDSPESPDVD